MLKKQHWELNPKYRPTRPFVEPFPVSFAKLLQLYCNVLHASKTTIRTAMNEDTTFWSQRPLTEAMREYAASDVQYLLLLHSLLSRELLIDYQMLVYSKSMEYCDQIRMSQDGVQGLGFQPTTYYQRPTLPHVGYQNHQVVYHQPHYQGGGGRGRGGYQAGYRPVVVSQPADIYQQYHYQQYQHYYPQQYPPQQQKPHHKQHKQQYSQQPPQQSQQQPHYPQPYQQQYSPNQSRHQKGRKRGGGASDQGYQGYQQQQQQHYQHDERPRKPKQYQQSQQQQQQQQPPQQHDEQQQQQQQSSPAQQQ
eukprot:TRINITY_DN438_c0_g1_i1.p1 TRINITY_DN438_c0_g1~~TRINITY_DN438_c0_g1_i1.p1  ORF type:complete len:305 (+),score=73.71 TRINITY_DN438_c0_g1_i1:925-1839(+)